MTETTQTDTAQAVKKTPLADWLESNPSVSQAEIARDLGVTDAMVSQIKSGFREIPIPHALKLEILYGADAGKLNKEVEAIRKLKPKAQEKEE